MHACSSVAVVVSDIAVFVLKRDVKLQLTHSVAVVRRQIRYDNVAKYKTIGRC